VGEADGDMDMVGGDVGGVVVDAVGAVVGADAVGFDVGGGVVVVHPPESQHARRQKLRAAASQQKEGSAADVLQKLPVIKFVSPPH